MRLLSFELPGLSGWERGCGKIELVDGKLALALDSVDLTGGRKPPASLERYSGFITTKLGLDISTFFFLLKNKTRERSGKP